MRRSLWLCRVNLCIQAEEAQQPKIAEQPLSEVERDQVRRYRELQRFLKGSPFYVRPPRQSEHAGTWPCSPSQTRRATTARETTVLIVSGRAISADLARYSDQYHTSEDSAGPRLAEYVSQTSYTKCRAFPAELLARHGENPHTRARAPASMLPLHEWLPPLRNLLCKSTRSPVLLTTTQRMRRGVMRSFMTPAKRQRQLDEREARLAQLAEGTSRQVMLL